MCDYLSGFYNNLLLQAKKRESHRVFDSTAPQWVWDLTPHPPGPISSWDKNEYCVSPVLVASRPHVLHGCEATGDTSEAVQVFQNGASHLQVIRVLGGLRESERQEAFRDGRQEQ